MNSFKTDAIIRFILIIWVMNAGILFAQEKYEYQFRDDLTYYERVKLAESYFEKQGREDRSGYKQFERWKYWSQRSLTSSNYVITQDQIQSELQKFNELYGGASDNAGNNSIVELGPKAAINTSTWSSALGRLTSLAFANDNTFNHIIAGAPTGGVWKTTNGGSTWTPIFDTQSTLSVWSVEISHANAQHYFVGTSGNGILKSTNGGSTWTQATGVATWDVINTIRMDPSNSNILYALGQWGHTVYKSTDGGNSWTTIHTDSDIRMYDLEFKPGTSSTFYVSGRGGILTTTNSGGSFTKITSPFLSTGTIMMAVSPANANYVYALQETQGSFYGLYRSTNSGSSFTLVTNNSSGNNNLLGYSLDEVGGQAPRDMDVIISPTNINEIQVAGIESHRSTNGGATWTQNTRWYIPSTLAFHHADVDALYYVNRNGVNRIYAATDGGIYYSTNSGQTFTDLTPGIGTRQFYRIGVSKTVEDWVCGGSQDNGTGVHRNNGNWYDWLGADGMECFVNNANHNIMYGTSQNGGLYKTINGGDTRSSLGRPPGRGAWVTPFEQDPVNTNTIYVGYQQLYKSTNGGTNWTAISNFGPPPNPNIPWDSTLQEVKLAPSSPAIIYAAFLNRFYKTINGGSSWTDVTPASFMSNNTRINFITVHPTNPNRLILALSSGVSNARFIESINGGGSWTNITSNLPSIGAECAMYKGDASDGIYVGMNPGLYYKNNASGGNWSNVGAAGNLPNVRVSELEMQHDILYIATYGRGLWKMDLANTCPDELTLNSTIGAGAYQAANRIYASGQVASGSTVSMQAGTFVQLNNNFHAVAGSEFHARIAICSFSTIVREEPPEEVLAQSRENDEETTPLQAVELFVAPNPIHNEAAIRFYTAEEGPASILVFDLNGQLLAEKKTGSANGWNSTLLDASQLPGGTYVIVLQTANKRLSEKVVVAR